jgi:citrate lyase beta subunit
MVSKADVLKTIRLPKVDRTEHVAVAKEVIKEIKKSVEIEKETSPSPLVETLKEVKETL